MLENPHVVQTETQMTAMIRLTVPRSEIQKVMGPAIQEVVAVVAAHGLTPTGPWFTHHLRMDTEVFDFQVCVPVPEPITEKGRVVLGEIPAATVARVIYRGAYEGLGDAWGEFDSWIKEQGHTSAPDLWEVYLTGMEVGPDASKWRTELNRPLLA